MTQEQGLGKRRERMEKLQKNDGKKLDKEREYIWGSNMEME